MAGSTIGTVFRVTAWGESHGAAVGAVIDGCPAGLAIDESDIQAQLDRRKPGQSPFATARQEADAARILSGVFEGHTTGSPISVMVENADQRSKDYAALKELYRPGHADYTFDRKYGFRDHRGGGRSSGRETAARVMGGAVARKMLAEIGVNVTAYTLAIGDIRAAAIDPAEAANNPLCMPDAEAAARAAAFLEDCVRSGDSAGGVIECVVTGTPIGLGEPVFDKLSADLMKAVGSIGAVKAVEIGAGAGAARLKGSENNDGFISANGGVAKTANRAGGLLGGMADGADIVLRAHIKPTPSIGKPQQTVSQSGENVAVEIKGRHDPVIAPRAVVVVESMACLALADHLLRNMAARMDNILKIYKGQRSSLYAQNTGQHEFF